MKRLKVLFGMSMLGALVLATVPLASAEDFYFFSSGDCTVTYDGSQPTADCQDNVAPQPRCWNQGDTIR